MEASRRDIGSHGAFVIAALALIFFLASQSVNAQETNSTNSTSNSTLTNLTISYNETPASPPNITINSTPSVNTTPTNPPATTPPSPSGNNNESDEHTVPAKIPSIPPVWSFDLAKVIPGDVKIGDSQINILIKNTGNQNLTNLNTVITGDGVSVYTQEQISSLNPSDSKYILAWINTKKSGKIPLSIRVQDKVFTASLNVVDSEQTAQAKKDAEELAAKRRKIREIQSDISNLSDIYEAFQKDYYIKESKGYDMTSININDAKSYLRNSQSALAKEDLTDSSANVVLLRAELSDLREKLVAAQPKPRTWKDVLKENIPLLSGIFGILVGGIAVYEKVKRKAEKVKANGLFNKGKKDDEEEGD